MVLPKFLFVVYEGLINFLVEDWDLWVSWGSITELVSIGDFGQYVLWDGFGFFADVASWDELFVCFDECVCY